MDSCCLGSLNRDVARLLGALQWSQSREATIIRVLCKWCTKYRAVVPKIHAPTVNDAVCEMIEEHSLLDRRLITDSDQKVKNGFSRENVPKLQAWSERDLKVCNRKK